jgi:hypothetical protein
MHPNGLEYLGSKTLSWCSVTQSRLTGWDSDISAGSTVVKITKHLSCDLFLREFKTSWLFDIIA